MKKLIFVIILLLSTGLSAIPNFVITASMRLDNGRIIQPDRIYMSEAIKAYNQKANGDAFNYFLKAAAFGNTLSQRYIGLMYINGVGVQKNLITGYAWLKLAKKDKTPRNIELEKRVAKLLNPTQMQQSIVRYENILEDYGTIASLTRRDRWVRKQMLKMTGTRTGSMVFAPLSFSRKGGIYDSIRAYVEDYNFGYVITGEIIPKDEETMNKQE